MFSIKISLNTTVAVTLRARHGLVCRIPMGISAERRALVKSIVKAANVILVGLLMYNLWNNKWTKLNFNKKATF